MWAVDWDEMGCTQYAATLEDAHKIGQRNGPFYIITYLGEPKCPQEDMQEDQCSKEHTQNYKQEWSIQSLNMQKPLAETIKDCITSYLDTSM